MMKRRRKATSKKAVKKTVWSKEGWTVVSGELQRGRGRPAKAVPLFSVVAEKLPFGCLDGVKEELKTLGIKPFGSNTLFNGDGSLTSPFAVEDARLARMAIRYILQNPAITAPIPGMINTAQVDNVVRAVQEHRKLDTKETAQLREANQRMWASLPEHYQWLKGWEYV